MKFQQDPLPIDGVKKLLGLRREPLLPVGMKIGGLVRNILHRIAARGVSKPVFRLPEELSGQS